MAQHLRLDGGERGKARMLRLPGVEIEPGSPRPAQRAGEGKLKSRQAADRLEIAERPGWGLSQYCADRDRKRVTVHAAQEPAGKPGGHAGQARDLHAMAPVPSGLKPDLVGCQTAMDDNCLSLRHDLLIVSLTGRQAVRLRWLRCHRSYTRPHQGHSGVWDQVATSMSFGWRASRQTISRQVGGE
jgi:hypothetical protein